MRYEWFKHSSWFLQDNLINHPIAYLSYPSLHTVIINLYDPYIAVRLEYPEEMSIEEIQADIEKAVCE